MSFMCRENLFVVTDITAKEEEELIQYMSGIEEFRYAFTLGRGNHISISADHENGELVFWAYNELNYGLDFGEMKALSIRFPELLFRIEGKNEDGEEYRIYWKNGRRADYSPIITWPKFKPEDLM